MFKYVLFSIYPQGKLESDYELERFVWRVVRARLSWGRRRNDLL
jgi:hypothetical protein